MKSIKLLLALSLLIVLFTTSCSTEKQAYLSNYHVGWKNSTYNLNKPKLVKNDGEKKNQEDNIVPENQAISQSLEIENENQKSEFSAYLENDDVFENEDFPPSSNVNISTPEDSIKEFDVLVLKNGAEIKVKVLEISEDEIKIKRFSDLNGPTITIEKSKVKLIRYGNGTIDDFKIAPKTIIDTTNTESNSDTTIETNTNSDTRVNPFALVGFILSMLTISLISVPYLEIIGLVLFGIPGVVLSIIGLNKIKKNPEKWSGRGFAIAGIIVPAAIFLVLILAIMLFILFAGGPI